LHIIILVFETILGCCLAQVRLTERQYLRHSVDDPLLTFLTEQKRLFGRQDAFLELVFSGEPLDYFGSQTRKALLKPLDLVERQLHMTSRVTSWLHDFDGQFEPQTQYLINRDTFVPVVDLVFLKDEK